MRARPSPAQGCRRTSTACTLPAAPRGYPRRRPAGRSAATRERRPWSPWGRAAEFPMRAIRILSTGLAAALLVTALLAGAVMGDDDDAEIEMTGVVLSVNLPNSSFQFREFASNVIWSVILRRDSRIELKGQGKDKSRNYRLVAGDIV